MHPYVCNQSRLTVFVAIAVLTVLIAPGLAAGFDRYVDLPGWLVSGPSFAGVFGVLALIYDRWLWRVSFKNWTLSGLPNLSGSYSGTLHSTFKQPNGKTATGKVRLHIEQRWRTIGIRMEVAGAKVTSTSVSAMAALTCAGSRCDLSYTYRSAVRPGVADDDMTDNVGTASLTMTTDGRPEGTYFNDRPRRGTLVLTKDD